MIAWLLKVGEESRRWVRAVSVRRTLPAAAGCCPVHLLLLEWNGIRESRCCTEKRSLFWLMAPEAGQPKSMVTHLFAFGGRFKLIASMVEKWKCSWAGSEERK